MDEDVLNMTFSYITPEVKNGVIKALGIPKFCKDDEFRDKMSTAYISTEEETRKYLSRK